MGIGVLLWILGSVIVSGVLATMFMYSGSRKGKLFEKKWEEDYIEIKDGSNKYNQPHGRKSYIVVVKDKLDLKDLEAVGWVTHVAKLESIVCYECIEEMVKYVERLPNVISIRESGTFHLTQIPTPEGEQSNASLSR